MLNRFDDAEAVLNQAEERKSAANKARAENGVPTLSQGLPVADDIPAVVGFIGHHHNDGVPGYVTKAVCNGAPKTVIAEVLDRFAFRDAGVDLPLGSSKSRIAADLLESGCRVLVTGPSRLRSPS